MAELLNALPNNLGNLQLDRCNAATSAQSAPQAVVVDQELGMLVKHNGVVLVLE
ncbi:hypothetical protein AB0H34_08365 [Saccharopolyspora shandongensis]|uniref:hypothetical protein n=1 Tax=Saccharopolyspora shandongensis TaxID=418495 RepID=UPI0033C62904